MARRLTRYADVLPVLEGLSFAVIEGRRRDGLTLRDLEAATSVSLNSLSRFERGGDIPLSTAVKLVRWLAGVPSGGDTDGS